MADFFAEVDEAMKQERLERFWGQYGNYIIGFLVLIVLATAAHAGYKSWMRSVNSKQTDLYLETTEGKNYTSEDLLNVSPKMRTGLRTLVKLQAASLVMASGDRKKALELYKALEADKKVDEEIRKLAAFNILNLVEDISVEETLKLYETMAVDEENPWRFFALLQAALLSAHELEDYKRARAHLALLIDAQKAPQTLRKKAQSLDVLYALKADIGQGNAVEVSAPTDQNIQ